ncbi:MAG: hypothetical protein H6719_01120 [Sandaracinaceae bacterium]|nr:hypothetical protein [Sandaracinaceae bacterium]
MGLLDFLKRKSPLERHAERVANKRTQNPDRWESIQTLGKMATTEPSGGKPDEREAAVAALLERFTFYCDPTITDGEEKDEAYRWVCEAGELAVGPVKAALRQQESLSWGMKCLEQLLPPDRFVEELVALLGTMSVEYERDPQRKLQLLSTLEEKRGPAIVGAVTPFFTAINEEARFHAYGAALVQDNAEDARAELLEALLEEDSIRVQIRVLTMLGELGWEVPENLEMPEGWFRDKKGMARKSTKKSG